jgi:WhiB family redox-sensing transcriptional regulator
MAGNLFDAIGLAPSLPGARCRGKHRLFDEAAPGEDPATVAARHAQAIGLCSHCPSLTRCQTWFLGLNQVSGRSVLSPARSTGNDPKSANADRPVDRAKRRSRERPKRPHRRR